jgi:hypothetical protein
MPFPNNVGNSDVKWSALINVKHGPFVVGSALYVVFPDKTNNKIEVWKSTDGGETWTEQDSAGEPSMTANVIGKTIYGCTLVSGIFYIGYSDSGLGNAAIKQFDTSTDLWGTRLDMGATGAATGVTAGPLQLYIITRSDGTHVGLHNGATETVMGTAYRRIKARYYNGTTWNGPYDVIGSANSPIANTLPGTQTHYDVRSIVLGASDRVHLFFTYSGGGLSQRTFLSGNTFANQQIANGGSSTIGVYAVGIPLTHGSTTLLVPFYRTATSDLSLIEAASADVPTWTLEQISATTVSNPEFTAANPGALAINGTTIHAFWPDDTTQDIYQDNDQGTNTWQTDVEWKDAVTCNGINIETFTYSGTTYVGVLYDDGGTVKFDRYQLSSAATSSPFFHRSARFVRRIRR